MKNINYNLYIFTVEELYPLISIALKDSMESPPLFKIRKMLSCIETWCELYQFPSYPLEQAKQPYLDL